MYDFKAGFSRVNVTPPMGLLIGGYYVDRFVEGVLDELEINAVALECKGKKAIIMTIDNCSMAPAIINKFRTAIAKATGLDMAAIFIHCTHTHCSPYVGREKASVNELNMEYENYLERQFPAAAVRAFQDLKPAKLGWAIGSAPDVAFVRRFRMKNGSVQTNPGIGNPDIVAPIGDVDERLNVVRIVREDAKEIVIGNFGNHPDTVGGSKVTGDWPAFTRRILERTLPNVNCIFFNGAQGDVNHIKVDAKDGDFNGIDPNGFDGVGRGYEHAEHIGRVVAGGILQVYTKVNFAPVDELKFVEVEIRIPSNMPKPEDLPLAYKYVELHEAGRDCDIPYEGMELTTVVAEAVRMKKLEHGPESFPLHLIGLSLGPVVMLGIPGEPFTGVGRAIKAGSKHPMTMPCCIVNGTIGYYPMKDAYDEGGYEARSSKFKAGVAEIISEESVKLINEML